MPVHIPLFSNKLGEKGRIFNSVVNIQNVKGEETSSHDIPVPPFLSPFVPLTRSTSFRRSPAELRGEAVQRRRRHNVVSTQGEAQITY